MSLPPEEDETVCHPGAYPVCSIFPTACGLLIEVGKIQLILRMTTPSYPFLQAAEKQVSQLVKDRRSAQLAVEKAERSLEGLAYDKGQEDGLDREKEEEEKTVENLREVREGALDTLYVTIQDFWSASRRL